MQNAAPASVLLSGFADEAAQQKTLTEQFVAFAALGLNHYTIRFVNAGHGIKNVMDLDDAEVDRVRQMQAEYGLRVASIGSPIGKVKLVDTEDGTSNRFVPFADYLENDLQRACDLALAFDTKLIRGFSFYPPKHDEVRKHLALAVDQIASIVDKCASHDLVFGLEVEANLVGRSGSLLNEIWQQINHPALVLIYDAANLLSQGYTPEASIAEYEQMKAGLGWVHVKDYKPADVGDRPSHIDEELLSDFRPMDQGSGVYQYVLRDLKDSLPRIAESLTQRGIPGFFLELEPHIKGGGQFGGFSGADGMGVAVRALTRLLDELQIRHDLRQFADTQSIVPQGT